MKTRRWLPLAGVLLLIAAVGVPPAAALRMPGRAAADKASARPLRDLDLAAMLEGRAPAEGAWLEADRSLPARCRTPQALAREDCDDDLRCSWLAARAAVARAWSGKVVRGKKDAASWLHRAANRLAVGGACGRRPARQQAWQQDRRQAALDDARVHLSLLLQVRSKSDVRLLEASAAQRVDPLVAKAEREGLPAVSPQLLLEGRSALRTAWERASWLAAHPGLVQFREILAELWEPVGGVPQGCGQELFRPDLADDQWRGYLVREIAPRALACLAERLPRRLERQGLRAADPEGGRLVAQTLATVASRDPGGRKFSKDPSLNSRLEELRRDFRAVSPPAAKARASSPPRKAKSKKAPSPKKRAAAAVRPPSGRSTRVAEPSRPAAADEGLKHLAGQVEAILGGNGELRREARRARGASAQKQLLERLIVTLHRRVCAPLEREDPDDLDAVRSLLDEIGLELDENACQAAEGRSYLVRLISAAPGLQKLAAASQMRAAARQVARHQPVLARHALDRIPDNLRGTTWNLLYAWAAREEGDPVTADRVLARLDEETLDALRATGHEQLARVVAHAWVSRNP